MSRKRPLPEDANLAHERSIRSFVGSSGESIAPSTSTPSLGSYPVLYHSSMAQPASSHQTFYVGPPYSDNPPHDPRFSVLEGELLPADHSNANFQFDPTSGLDAGTDVFSIREGSFNFNPFLNDYQQTAANPASISREAPSVPPLSLNTAASNLEPTTPIQPQRSAVKIGKRPSGQLQAVQHARMESPVLGTILVKLSLRRYSELSPKAGFLKAEVAKAAELDEETLMPQLEVGQLFDHIQAFVKLFADGYFPYFISGEVMAKMTAQLRILVKACRRTKAMAPFSHAQFVDARDYLLVEIAAITAAFQHKQKNGISHWYTYQNVEILKARETSVQPTEN